MINLQLCQLTKVLKPKYRVFTNTRMYHNNIHNNSIMNKNKIIYWIATGILVLIFTMSAGMYFFKNPNIQAAFTSLGFPVWLIYPLAVAKLLAITAILTKKSALLKEWAYAGLFFDAAMALTAHLMVNDGNQITAIVALTAVIVSRVMDSKV